MAPVNLSPRRKMMIDVVIVNWNSGHLLADCLASLDLPENAAVMTVTVIDNASSDGSLYAATDYAAKSFDYRVLVNASNEGFAAACNRGAARGEAEFILFLNPDCELFPDTIRQLITAVERTPSPSYAVFGIGLVNRKGEIARTCARQPTPADFWKKLLGVDRLSGGRIVTHIMTEWDHTTSRDVDHVMGAFYLIRRDVFTQLGGFDERFFVYFEDLDLSRRVLAGGYRIRFLADAKAFHESGGTSKNVKATRLFYSLRSRILFGLKNFSPIAAWSLTAGTLLLEPLTRLAFALVRADLREAGHTLHGSALLWLKATDFLKPYARSATGARNLGEPGRRAQ